MSFFKDKEQYYETIRGFILNHPNKDGSGTNRTNAIEPLSKISNISILLRHYYKKKPDFKTIVDNRFENVDNLIKLVENKEAENRLKKIEDEEKADSLRSETIAIESLFEEKLKEMQDKLPPKLLVDENNGFVGYSQVSDKEFCYKFLYCWLNNEINKTNSNVIKVCNSILKTYGIKDERFPKLVEDITVEDITIEEEYDITFDVGFIINIESVKKGGTPTQKRRPNKLKKRNRTIKDRVRVKMR